MLFLYSHTFVLHCKMTILSFSERSDSSSARSKSESRNPLLRQASAPTSTSKRLARAKELIIPAFTSAGRRMRRPSSVDQGPIQIKLGRSDSSKSIEGSDSSPQVCIHLYNQLTATLSFSKTWCVMVLLVMNLVYL